MAAPELGVPDPKSFTRREAEYPDLALVEVAMHRQSSLASSIQRENLTQRRMNEAASDQIVSASCLCVVGHVGAADPWSTREPDLHR
jgi:hypothetical protein